MLLCIKIIREFSRDVSNIDIPSPPFSWGVNKGGHSKNVSNNLDPAYFFPMGKAIWLCLFLTRAVFNKGRKFDLCESYPRIIPRIIPPNHTQKNHDYECFFWDRLGLHWPH